MAENNVTKEQWKRLMGMAGKVCAFNAAHGLNAFGQPRHEEFSSIDRQESEHCIKAFNEGIDYEEVG